MRRRGPNCILMLFAGHKTTVSLLGYGMYLLLRAPDELRKLRGDPALVASAVNEMMRFVSPAHVVDRIALDDVVVGGKTIRRGQRVSLAIAAANHDPEQFASADTFDVTRPPGPLLSFGTGVHRCLGSTLAQMEAEVAVSTLLRRLPGLRLQPGLLAWTHDFHVPQPLTMEVAFDPVG